MAENPYMLLGGETGVRALANAFYDVMDEEQSAEKIRNMHGDNLSEIKEKLYEYLSGWMGGPPLYSQKHGTVCLTDPHAHYHIGPDERDQWLMCMDKALEKIDASDELKEMLHVPMRRLANAVQNQESSDIPDRDPSIIAVG